MPEINEKEQTWEDHLAAAIKSFRKEMKEYISLSNEPALPTALDKPQRINSSSSTISILFISEGEANDVPG